jgi:hypothetical protein
VFDLSAVSFQPADDKLLAAKAAAPGPSFDLSIHRRS